MHELLQRAARVTTGLANDPEPFVRQRALSDFYVEYELNAFTSTPEKKIEILSDLHAAIQDLFNEHGVQIMSPHYESDKASPVVIPKENWYTAPASPKNRKAD